MEVNRADWATSRKIPTGHVETTILEEIADALQDSGIEVQLIHAEAAPGQVRRFSGSRFSHESLTLSLIKV